MYLETATAALFRGSGSVFIMWWKGEPAELKLTLKCIFPSFILTSVYTLLLQHLYYRCIDKLVYKNKNKQKKNTFLIVEHLCWPVTNASVGCLKEDTTYFLQDSLMSCNNKKVYICTFTLHFYCKYTVFGQFDKALQSLVVCCCAIDGPAYTWKRKYTI